MSFVEIAWEVRKLLEAGEFEAAMEKLDAVDYATAADALAVEVCEGGTLYREVGDLPTAFTFYEKWLKLCEVADYKKGQVSALNLLGHCLMEMGAGSEAAREEALDYYLRALRIVLNSEENMLHRSAITLKRLSSLSANAILRNKLAEVAEWLKQFDEAD